MAKSVISGLTITIGADTAKFTTAMKNIDSEARRIAKDLKTVGEQLKLDPSSVTKTSEKLKLLQEAANKSSEKVATIKKAIEALNKQYAEGKVSQEEYSKTVNELSRNLESASREQDLANEKVKQFGSEAKSAGNSAMTFGEMIKAHVISHAIFSGLEKLKDLALSIARHLVEVGKNIWNYSKGAIELAGQYQDAAETSKRAFAEYSQDAIKFAEKNSLALGLYEGSMLESMNTLGLMFSSMGLGRKESLEMSEELISLAADIRAAFGGDMSSILDALSRSFTTSLKNLKAFGVFISEAELKAYALSSGIVKTTVDQTKLSRAMIDCEKAEAALAKAIDKYGEESLEARDANQKLLEKTEKLEEVMGGQANAMTSAQRSTAILGLTLERLSDISGQASAESDKYPALVERVNAALQNLKRTIGTELLPIAEDLLKRFMDFYSSPEGQTIVEKIKKEVKEIAEKIPEILNDGTLEEVINKIIDETPKIIENLSEITQKIIELSPKIFELTERLLSLFGIETESEKAKKAYMAVADQVELMASRMHISTETARTAVNEFAETNDIKLSEIYSNWQQYEPQIIAFMGDVANGAEDLEKNYKAHLESLPEATRNAITDISATDMSPLESFLYKVGWSIESYVQQYIDAWNKFKAFVMSGTDENPTPNVSWEDQPAFDPNFISLNANGRASGGFVRKGGFYRINDDAGHRIEAFVPGQNGYILNGNQVDRIVNNNNSRNFSGGVTINAYCPGLTVAQVADELGTAFYDAIRIPGRSL